MNSFISSSPLGYASEATTLMEDAIKLIEVMEKDEDDFDSLNSLRKDKIRFQAALELMYEVLRDT